MQLQSLDPATLTPLDERVWRYFIMLFNVTDPDLTPEELKSELETLTDSTLFAYRSPNARVRSLRQIYNDSVSFELERDLAAKYYRDLSSLVITPRLQMACRKELREWLQLIQTPLEKIKTVLPEELLINEEPVTD